jgi:sugar phosphate isomerase/epimerase
MEPAAPMRLISLDHLTLLTLTPPELVQAAAAAGFRHVGLRLNPAAPPQEQAHPMLGRSALRRETLACLRDTGVAVFDFGVFRLRQGMDLDALEPVLACAAELGAHHAVVNGDEPDLQVAAALLHALCERARPYGIGLHLEPTPWSGVPNLRVAQELLQACAHEGARLLVDALHLVRSGGSVADVVALPPQLLGCVQLCEPTGPTPSDVATMIYQARHERALPGEGVFDLQPLLAVLPENLPWSLEAPVDTLAGHLTVAERAQRAWRSVQRLEQTFSERRVHHWAR